MHMPTTKTIYKQLSIRSVGEPPKFEFVAHDLCHVLGLGSTAQALKAIPKGQQMTRMVETVCGSRKMLTVTKAGALALIQNADQTKETKAFLKWFQKQFDTTFDIVVTAPEKAPKQLPVPQANEPLVVYLMERLVSLDATVSYLSDRVKFLEGSRTEASARKRA